MKLAVTYMEKSHLMDVNEKNQEINQLFEDTNFMLVRLETGRGDYESCDVAGSAINFERKEDDFFGSLFSGHLYEQLLSMYERGECRAYYLVVTKSYDQLLMEADVRGIHPNVLLGAVVRLSQMGFPPIFIESPEHSVKFIESMCEKFRENPTATKTINRCVTIVSNNIIKFPNVGDKIGERLIEHFGNIRAICNASAEELQEVKGIGRQTAEKIYNFANGINNEV